MMMMMMMMMMTTTTTTAIARTITGFEAEAHAYQANSH
jgi:hypothetical protein